MKICAGCVEGGDSSNLILDVLVGLAVISVFLDIFVLTIDPLLEEVGHSSCTRPNLILMFGLWMWVGILRAVSSGGINLNAILIQNREGRSSGEPKLKGNDSIVFRSDSSIRRYQRWTFVAALLTIAHSAYHGITIRLGASSEDLYWNHMDTWHLAALVLFGCIVLCLCVGSLIYATVAFSFEKDTVRGGVSFVGALLVDIVGIVSTFWHVVLSPLTPVHFPEVLVGDWLTSLAKLFGDVSICLCVMLTGHIYVSSDGDSDSDVASDLAKSTCLVSLLTPAIVSLPFVWRLLQCGRRYVETKDRSHLANAFKYMTGIAVVFSSTYRRLGGSSYLFWTSVAVNSLYSFWWDVHMDWGLFHGSSLSSSPSTSTTRWLPDVRNGTLFGGSKPAYIFAGVLDFVLRISWSLKLSSSYGEIFDGEYSSLFGQVLEIFRRSMWTCFRLEWEHLCRSSQAGSSSRNKYAPVPKKDHGISAKSASGGDGSGSMRKKGRRGSDEESGGIKIGSL